jgi:hypothetical protein
VQAGPSLCIVYAGIHLTTEEKSRKPPSGYPKGAKMNSAGHYSLSRLGGGFDCPVDPGRPWLAGQTTRVSVGVRRVAELRGSPHRLIFSQNSQLGL